MTPYKKLVALAREIKALYDDRGIVDREKMREMDDIAAQYEICIYFNEDDIPEQVEDERL